MNSSIVVHGRIIIDDFHERYFLFVSASSCLRLDGKIISVSSLPATDVQLAAQLFDGLPFDNGREFPLEFPFSALNSFRILRLFVDFDPNVSVVSQDMLESLEQKGDSSRAVTISGHIATDAEKARHDKLTEPTITPEKLATFEIIQKRAFEIFQFASTGSAVDNWLQAERELLASG